MHQKYRAMHTLLSISLIFLFAGFTQGFSGFGSALFAMPLLTLFIDTKVAVPLCILNSVLITIYLTIKLRGYMERNKILPLLVGCLPGIYAGVTFLKQMESESIRFLLGALIISYGLYSLFYQSGAGTVHRIWGYVAGFFTGFIGSAFSVGGPPAIIYTSLSGWSKDQIKATLTGFFLTSSIVTAAVHAATGLTTGLVLKYFYFSGLPVLAGVYAGSLLYSRVTSREYLRVILAVLILLGVMMCLSSIL